MNQSQNKKLKKWQKCLLVFVGCVLLLVGAGIFLFKHYYNMIDVQDAEEVLVETDLQEETIEVVKEESEENIIFAGQEMSEKAINVMLVGVDSKEDSFEGRTDTMLLFSINPETKKAVVTSFLRDIYLDIPGYGGNRLNAAYVFGGTQLMSETILKNFGISVDNYVIVNFWLVKDVIDAFGGVEMDITTEEIEQINKNMREQNRLMNNTDETDYLSASDAGKKLLNGNQALGYARIRYIDNDFERTSRQREIVSALVSKMMNMNIKEVNSLLEQFLPKVKTNLSQKDLMTLLFMSLGIKDYTIESMAIPIDGTWKSSRIRDMSVIEIDFDANAQAWRDKLLDP